LPVVTVTPTLVLADPSLTSSEHEPPLRGVSITVALGPAATGAGALTIDEQPLIVKLPLKFGSVIVSDCAKAAPTPAKLSVLLETPTAVVTVTATALVWRRPSEIISVHEPPLAGVIVVANEGPLPDAGDAVAIAGDEHPVTVNVPVNPGSETVSVCAFEAPRPDNFSAAGTVTIGGGSGVESTVLPQPDITAPASNSARTRTSRRRTIEASAFKAFIYGVKSTNTVFTPVVKFVSAT
jgi:hypothetical protein